MKTILSLISLFITLSAFAVDGLTIPNSHQVDTHGQVFRGKEPGKLVDELAHFGITDVIIFKNQTKTEVDKEISRLNELGLTSHHIPFAWKDVESMTMACEQVVEALQVIHKTTTRGGSVFFHCTAGEDRTGLLAGVFRMLDQNWSTQKAFKEEMCARGYSDGNYKKPYSVTSAIQKDLTPLFLAIAEKIEKGEWKMGKLTKKSCAKLVVKPTTLKCKTKN